MKTKLYKSRNVPPIYIQYLLSSLIKKCTMRFLIAFVAVLGYASASVFAPIALGHGNAGNIQAARIDAAAAVRDSVIAARDNAIAVHDNARAFGEALERNAELNRNFRVSANQNLYAATQNQVAAVNAIAARTASLGYAAPLGYATPYYGGLYRGYGFW